MIVRKVLNLVFWRNINHQLVRHREINRSPKTQDCEIINLNEYRDTIPSDKRWVNHYLWYSGLFAKARRRRLARMRDSSNFRNNPRRR